MGGQQPEKCVASNPPGFVMFGLECPPVKGNRPFFSGGDQRRQYVWKQLVVGRVNVSWVHEKDIQLTTETSHNRALILFCFPLLVVHGRLLSSHEMHKFLGLWSSHCPATHLCFRQLLPVQTLASTHCVVVISLRKPSQTDLTHLELPFLGLLSHEICKRVY